MKSVHVVMWASKPDPYGSFDSREAAEQWVVTKWPKRKIDTVKMLTGVIRVMVNGNHLYDIHEVKVNPVPVVEPYNDKPAVRVLFDSKLLDRCDTVTTAIAYVERWIAARPNWEQWQRASIESLVWTTPGGSWVTIKQGEAEE